LNRLNILWNLLGLNALLFIGVLMWLGTLQIPSADDLIYLKWVEELGIWNSTMMFHQEWNTRWTAILINQTYLSIIPKQILGLTYQATNLILGVLAFYPITKFINPGLSVLKRFILSVSLLLSLFFLSFGLSDSWFWMCSQPAYLWSTLVSIWMISILFKESSNKLAIPLLILAHVFVGGASEIIAISVLLIEMTLFIFSSRFPLINKKLLGLGMACLIGSFAFSLTGEGIESRYAHLSPPGLIDGVIITFKSYLRVLIYGVGSKLAIVGSVFIVLLPIKSQSSIRPLFDWKIPFGIADGVLICSMIITAFTLGDIGPNRALIHIPTMVLLLVILAIPFIHLPFLTEQLLRTTSIALCVLVAGYLSFTLMIEIPKESLYSKALTERNESIQSQTDVGSTEIKLNPLPDSKFLYRAEISVAPYSENNKQLSTIYGDDLTFILIVPE
jgi:hypothetical protein